MNKQSLTALAGIVMFVAIVALWIRVQSLDQTIQALNKRLATVPPVAVVPIAQPRSANKANKEPVFKLIEGAKHNERTSNVGVPWEVERATMGESRERERKLEDKHRQIESHEFESPVQPAPPDKTQGPGSILNLFQHSPAQE